MAGAGSTARRRHEGQATPANLRFPDRRRKVVPRAGPERNGAGPLRPAPLEPRAAPWRGRPDQVNWIAVGAIFGAPVKKIDSEVPSRAD